MNRFFLTAVFLIAATMVNAQSKPEIKVEASVAGFIKAMEDGNVTALADMTADKLTYGHSSGKVQNKKEFLESFSSGATDFVKINIGEQTIDLFGNTAIVRHVLEADTNDNKKPGHVKLKILTVWQKHHGKWLLLARQAVKPAA